ncbi:methylmalonyl-CoA mutase family protein, partial [Rhodocaloribacter sp.]
MRPDFSNIDYRPHTEGASPASSDAPPWITAEGVPVRRVFTEADLEGMEHLAYAAGLPPFLRGPYASMYTVRPWTIRQYAGFSTA